jgi:hypothetical protein
MTRSFIRTRKTRMRSAIPTRITMTGSVQTRGILPGSARELATWI